MGLAFGSTVNDRQASYSAAGIRDQRPVIVIGPTNIAPCKRGFDHRDHRNPKHHSFRRTISRMTDLKFTKLIRVHVVSYIYVARHKLPGLGQGKGGIQST